MRRAGRDLAWIVLTSVAMWAVIILFFLDGVSWLTRGRPL